MRQLPPIPSILSHLKVEERGYPVPYFTTALGNGKHDFRILDAMKIHRAIHNNLCGICGNKLHKDGFYFISGTLGFKNRTSQNPPMHRTCAEYSLEVCPHIKFEKADRRGLDEERDKQFNPNQSFDKPSEWYLVKSDKFKIQIINQQELLIYRYLSHQRYVYVNGILQLDNQ